MQKHVNLVDLVKSFPTSIYYLDVFSIYLEKLASIQSKTSLEEIWKNEWNLGIWTGENFYSNFQKKQFEL